MDLYYLKVFNLLAQELSFSRTADKLYISQPAVSIQIKKLEQSLGVKLFEKLGKNLYLTENGQVLFGYTTRIFSLVEEAENCLAGMTNSVRGSIQVGASNTPGTYILPRVLGEFKELFPDVTTNLHITSTYEVEKLILENKIDFAVNGGNIPYTDRISVEKLAEDEVVLVTSPNGILAEYEEIDGRQLENVRCVTHERNSMLYKVLEGIFHEIGLQADIVMTLGNIDAVKQAVSANLGISAIPKSAIRTELKHGLLLPIKIRGRSWTYPYNLIYHKSRFLPLAAEKLMELVRERMKGI